MAAIHVLSHRTGALKVVGGSGRLQIKFDANGVPIIPRAFAQRISDAVATAIDDDISSAFVALDDELDIDCLFTVRRARESGSAIISITDLATPAGNLSTTMLVAIFGLTPTEAKIALALYAGHEADEIAESRNVSIDTVRSQIKNLLNKTNLRNQKRLIALLSRIAMSLPHQEADEGNLLKQADV